ncbi:MAG: molybdopterin-synthase adenylyltransferase MoeB [Nitrospira sp.]|nr:molybdopterin-synthase adenylyltransferase MoeB [Nitrospira sp.]
MEFTEEQFQRYSRQIILPEVGEEGQKKIGSARVFLVGAGGLGSSVGYYLTAAGIGTITIIDNDKVELSNLQRQIAHTIKTLGMPKAESAKETFQSLNPDVHVVAIKQRLTKENILDLIRDYDIVIDCSDNFPTRFLVNDACVMTKKILVTGAVSQFEGQVMAVIPGVGPCYRCLFEEPPVPDAFPSSHDVGILGVVPGVIGILQATEVLKILLGKGEILKDTLLIYNALTATFRKVTVPKRPDCSVCGDNPKELLISS